jgi:hypothetical protein
MSNLFQQYKDAATIPPETKAAIDEKKRIKKEALGEEAEPISEPLKPTPLKPKPKIETAEEDDKPYESTGMKAIDRVRGLFRTRSKDIEKSMGTRYSKDVGKLPSGWSADQLDIIMANKRHSKRSSKQ